MNKNEQGINVVDLFVYMLSKWKWFLLSIVICGGAAWFLYARAPFVYFRSATVIIKDPSNKTSTAGLDRYDNYINRVNVANEILQFRSCLYSFWRSLKYNRSSSCPYFLRIQILRDHGTIFNGNLISEFISISPEKQIKIRRVASALFIKFIIDIMPKTSSRKMRNLHFRHSHLRHVNRVIYEINQICQSLKNSGLSSSIRPIYGNDRKVFLTIGIDYQAVTHLRNRLCT